MKWLGAIRTALRTAWIIEELFYLVLLIVSFGYVVYRMFLFFFFEMSLESSLIFIGLAAVWRIFADLLTSLARRRNDGWEKFLQKFDAYYRRRHFETCFPDRYQERNYRK